MSNENGALSDYNYFEIGFSFVAQVFQFLTEQVQQFLILTAGYQRFAPIGGWGTGHPAICIRTDCVHPILVDYFVLVINSCAMGSLSTNHGSGRVRINTVKD
jgi:hypothetical protein